VLPPVRRLLIAATAAAFGIVLVLTARRAAEAPTTSDTAVIESYTLMAAHGHLLLGAYSRFQWHHPGPLYFYALAPFYAASGEKTAGLHAGAAALSMASVALIAAVLLRRRPMLAVIACAALTLYCWRASEAIASPWNPHVPLLPVAALIVVAADVVAGEVWLVPVVALLASLAAQAHIALAPVAATLGAAAFLRGCLGAVRSSNRLAWRRSLAATLLTLAAVWSLPVYEQFVGQPHGNMTELWHFFVRQPRHGQSLSVAVSAWSDMLVGILRRDFYVAHGWPFRESPVRWAEWLSFVELAGVSLFTLRGAIRRAPFDAALGALLLVASGVALWSTTRIADGIFDHDVFWIAGIGVLTLSVAAEFVIASVTGVASVPRPMASVVSSMLVVVSGVLATRQLQQVVDRSFDPPPEARIARALADDLTTYLARDTTARPLVRIDQDAWGVTAGALLELQKRGRIVPVEEDWVVMFTPAFRPTGREDRAVIVAAPPEHLRLVDRGVPQISDHQPVYAHVQPLEH
jgi:hypothetical protein